MKVEKATAYVVLTLYVVILFTLLRPGGTGQAAVTNWGLGLTGLLTV